MTEKRYYAHKHLLHENEVHDKKYKCHICKHLHNDETLKLYCDINGVDFLKKYYDCRNFEDYRNFLKKR